LKSLSETKGGINEILMD